MPNEAKNNHEHKIMRKSFQSHIYKNEINNNRKKLRKLKYLMFLIKNKTNNDNFVVYKCKNVLFMYIFVIDDFLNSVKKVVVIKLRIIKKIFFHCNLTFRSKFTLR